MRILLTGGHGFVGSGIAAALCRSGHAVVIAARNPRSADVIAGNAVACDMSCDVLAEDWLPRLAGIDAIVNCAGILRERAGDTFQAVHVDAPLALFRACVTAGARRVVQISAIGDARDAEFVASKHRCDVALAELDLDWVVLRPSVVYSTTGSYGGTSLLRAQAALPWVLCVPGDGAQAIQPVSLEDVAAAVVASIERPQAARQMIELAGPAVLSIREYLLRWRRWLGVAEPRVLQLPQPLVGMTCAVGEVLGAGPLGNTMRRMLERGNIAAPDALARMDALLALRPVALEDALHSRPAQSQDRQHATLYFLFPLLQWCLALVWLISAATGFVTPVTQVRDLFASAGLPAALGPPLVCAVSLLDAVLGLLVLSPRTMRFAALWMLASVLGYTVLIGVFWPLTWLEPFGGLVKNLALIPALLFLLAWTR